MLVLSRKIKPEGVKSTAESQIVIGDNIIVTILESRGQNVRVGIEAPKDVPVHRAEVYAVIYAAIQREGKGDK